LSQRRRITDLLGLRVVHTRSWSPPEASTSWTRWRSPSTCRGRALPATRPRTS